MTILFTVYHYFVVGLYHWCSWCYFCAKL